ncbi:S-type anion channel [Klebsormidium nitens]|uniref:S-type anion channel n=1 Tax=Klebsormidium nitens TaxID=105231 RepID=A0A1Y1HRL0_KLENI|nr:S-type anion channel [Klebsormidium nitens]|eukprot:GAQ79207.1 S-type anion channel [Klebsormidium nitens]
MTTERETSIGSATEGGRWTSDGEGSVPIEKDLESNQKSLQGNRSVKFKTPFLLRFKATVFGINLGIGSQALLWQQIGASPAMRFLQIPSGISLAVWCVGVLLLFVIPVTYLLKLLVWPKAVRREFQHPIRTNFLIAPWWAALLLCLGAPGEITDRIYGEGKSIHWGAALAFSIPLLASEMIMRYSHWIYGYEDRLTTTANPACQIALKGNFISAIAFARAGWPDPALFMLSVGLIHWLVVFNTLYMRPGKTQELPRPLTPLYFLLIAPPAVVATAWAEIQGPGEFDRLSKGFTFASLGLFLVLAARGKIMFHWTFSFAWWGFVFPTAAVAVSFMLYADAMPDTWQRWVVRALALFFWATSVAAFLVSSCVSLGKLCIGTLFPDDEVTESLLEEEQ